ncbi:ABC-three component system middle component 1 [Brevundimonas sp.]|uniref:ABC-three component system middle component 1 n=1 Tax=Brevundimonas sp. TaxID=1871086 RepID=UPI003D0FDD65
MTLTEFCDRVLDAATGAGWTANRVDDYAARRFPSGDDEVSPLKSGEVVGLQLGDYPVLAATLHLNDRAALAARLKSLHGQVVIARAYMRPHEVINTHLFLCATESGAGDWESIVDIAERDESVCRKVVWVPPSENVDQSFDAFVSRTFLARPWEGGDAVLDAPLDHNRNVVKSALVAAGLDAAMAVRWEQLVDKNTDDPDVLVEKLVALMEAKP